MTEPDVEASSSACTESFVDRFYGWYIALFNGTAIFTTVVAATVLGLSSGLVADDLGAGRGLVVGAVLGTAVYGLIMVACLALAVLAVPVDLVLWGIRWLRRRRD